MPSQGRYSVAKLIAKHGRKGNMSAWVSNRTVTARSATPSGSKTAATWQDRCDVVCPEQVL